MGEVIQNEVSVSSDFSSLISNCVELFDCQVSNPFCECCSISGNAAGRENYSAEKEIIGLLCQHLSQEATNVQSISDTIDATDTTCANGTGN